MVFLAYHMPQDKLERYFFTALFLGALFLVGLLLYPYFGALAVALVLAVLVHPLYLRILSVLKSESFSALAAVLIALVAILIPASALGYLIVGEVRTAGESLRQNTSIVAAFDPVQEQVNARLPQGFKLDVRRIAGEVVGWLSNNIAAAFASTASFVLKLFVSLIALYYFIKDGPAYKQLLLRFSPLTDDADEEILHKLELVTHALVRGRLMIAVIQGALTSIGFLMVGLPNPILWGSVAAVTAILPTVGTAFVTVPAFLYLVVIHAYVPALVFAIWGIVVIGLVDNILGPRLMGHGRGVSIHPLLILLSVLGGLELFGASGFLTGPLLLAFLIALGHIYAHKYGDHAAPAVA